MARLPIRAVGLAWYDRLDYRRILKIMDDANVLPRTYEQWLKGAEAGERQLLSTRHTVVRAIIDPEEFPAWCQTRGLNIDAKARVQFASEAAIRQVKGTH